ncbi:MAG TPA: hypothetical protein VGZ26_10380 [Pirellulales bacterium]|nr:hypothetical protein [Pirellulales bacterium]
MALFVIYAAVADYRASARLEQKIAALRAAGEPTRLADLAREPIRPENNAATYLDRAESDILAVNKEVWASYETASEAEQKEFDEGGITPTMRNSIRAALEAYPHAIALLARAADCTDYDPQLIVKNETGSFVTDLEQLVSDQLPRIQNQRAAMRVLDYHAMLMVADGKPEEAMSDPLLMLRLNRKFELDAMMVGYLVAVACRNIAIHRANEIMRLGPISDEAHNLVDRELAQADEIGPFQRAMKRERVYGMQMFSELASQRSQFGPVNLEWVLGGKFKNDECDYLDAFRDLISATSRPYLPLDKPISANIGALAKSIIPSLKGVQEARYPDQAMIRCLRVLNAIQRHPPIDTTEVDVAALGLPKEATIDPFTGKSLHVKKSGDGWLVYSVGPNLIDDGGTLDPYRKSLDIGLGPTKRRGD